METRRFGRTGHMSTMAIFGAYAVSKSTQAEADAVMEHVISTGVNHIDVAPSYGDAEARLGPWLARERDRFFLGCKTQERSKNGAAAQMRESLQRLQVDNFDLYQFHGVNSVERVDQIIGPEGALEAVLEARDKGLTRFIGITGHVPATLSYALDRFEFDSVLFPYNFIQAAQPAYQDAFLELIDTCRTRDLGVMIIKSVAKGPWGEQPQTLNTWYEPFLSPEEIQRCVNFVLSQDITGICTAGDPGLLPLILEACENYTPLETDEQESLVKSAVGAYEPLFVGRLEPKTL